MIKPRDYLGSLNEDKKYGQSYSYNEYLSLFQEKN